MRHAHKIGAVFYILWGLIHVLGGAIMFQRISADGAMGGAAVMAPVVPIAEQAPIPMGLADGVFLYHAWNILWFGLFAIVVAVLLNWKNSRLGYWANFAVLGAAEIGLIAAMIWPGHMKAGPDTLSGLVLWALGVLFTTMGYLKVGRAAI
ncbi:MAG: hypothetical protein HKM89_02240 [Gemmatimonadales bacterium]|nr:hypothetical protein [Gemmatimonadales bacterium]